MDILKSVSGNWERIEQWAEVHFRELYDTFKTGANPKDIKKLERTLGNKLPVSLKTSLLRHNGQSGHPALIWYYDVYRLLSVKEIIEEVQYKKRHSSKKLTAVPVAKCGTGDCIWITVIPVEKMGIMRLRAHEGGVKKVAVSLESWLENFADDLEAGRYTINEYDSLGRKFPTGEAYDQLIKQALEAVNKSQKELSVKNCKAWMAATTNQPKWIVDYFVSDHRIEMTIRRFNYKTKSNNEQ